MENIRLAQESKFDVEWLIIIRGAISILGDVDQGSYSDEKHRAHNLLLEKENRK